MATGVDQPECRFCGGELQWTHLRWCPYAPWPAATVDTPAATEYCKNSDEDTEKELSGSP